MICRFALGTEDRGMGWKQTGARRTPALPLTQRPRGAGEAAAGPREDLRKQHPRGESGSGEKRKVEGTFIAENIRNFAVDGGIRKGLTEHLETTVWKTEDGLGVPGSPQGLEYRVSHDEPDTHFGRKLCCPEVGGPGRSRGSSQEYSGLPGPCLILADSCEGSRESCLMGLLSAHFALV